MTIKNKSRSIDVLNTSVSELMLLTVFFVLLALAIAQADLIGVESDRDGLASRIIAQETEISELKRRLDEIKKTMGLTAQELDETLFKRKVQIDDLEQKLALANIELATVKLKNQQLTSQLTTATSERDQLRQSIQTLTNGVNNLDATIKAIAEIKRIAAAHDIDPDAPLDQMIRDIESQMGKNIATMAQLRKKLKSAGIVEQETIENDGEVITARCWNSENRRPDAALTVAIRANGFHVSKAWPAVRNADATSSRSLIALSGSGNTSINNFRKLGRDVRAESEKRKPPCIYVVNVRVDTKNEPSASQFRKLRDVVGRYFYIR